MKYLNLMTKSELYKCAAENTRNKLLQYGKVKIIKKNEYLFHIRDKVNTVYVILSGYAVLKRDSDEHGTKAVFLISDGDIANEVILDKITASISCCALSELYVWCFTREQIFDLMNYDFAVAQYFINSMSLKIRRLYHMVESSTKTTRIGHQISSRIWKFARDYGIEKDGYIEIPFQLRTTLIAEFVGSNRETVSRAIGEMKKKNLVTLDKGVCRIYDMNGLKNYMKY